MTKFIFTFLPKQIVILANNKANAIETFLKMFTEENPLEHFNIQEKDDILDKMHKNGIGNPTYRGDKGN